MPFHILQKEPLAHGLQRIAREQINIALGDLSDDAVSLHHKVHSVRARCKKLRGLLRLPGPVMGDAFEIEDQRYRETARRLARHRDDAVYALGVAALGGAANARRTKQHAAETVIAESREAMSACLRAVDDWPLAVNGFSDIAPGFARTYRKAAARWRAVMDEPSDERFHQLRKWTKYHWYQVRILEHVNKPRLKQRRARLRRLQLALGDAHDLVLLEARHASGGEAGGRLVRRATARKDALYAEAKKIGRRVYAKDVDALVADLARWWAIRA